MLKLLQYLKNSHFVRNISIVMSGTAIAQIIGFALAPIISRLFNPSDFGIFGSFISVLVVVTAGVTLQYSQAIMLPKHDEDAANIFAISILSVFIFTLVSLLFAYIFSDWLLGLLKAPQSKWLLWFLPFGIFISGINQSFQAWCIRRKAFKKTAFSQIIRAGSISTLQIVSGLFRHGSGGLIASSVAADGISSVNLAHQVFCTDKVLLKSSLAWKRIGRLAVEYRDFPIYSATQNMMNALSQGLPVLLLSHFYGIAIAGSYAFGLRLLQVPMNFVLIALRQVLFQKASETYNHGGSLLPLYVKTTSGLFALAFLPSLVLFMWSPQIFAWAFGAEWYSAGEFARWLVLWLMVLFCNLPSTLFARILRQQRNLFFYEWVILFSRVSALVLGGLLLSAKGTIILFSVVGCLVNVFYILWIGCLLRKDHVNIGTGKEESVLQIGIQ
jgi:lipopolysaccharide exporter